LKIDVKRLSFKVNVYGGGTFDGNGQAWYDLYASDPYTLRPILFGTIDLHGGTIEDINLRYSPQWYNLVANSTDVVFSNITISGESVSSNTAKNTDGCVRSLLRYLSHRLGTMLMRADGTHTVLQIS
jgi:polygalacturonase